jgi:hypothetical protein
MTELNRKTKVWLLVIACWIVFIALCTITIVFPLIGFTILLGGLIVLITLTIKLVVEDNLNKQPKP